MLVLEKKSDILKKPKTYQLVVDGEKVIMTVTRIKTLTSIYLNLFKTQELFPHEGFFIHKCHTFSSFFFKQELDLLFVDKDGFIIKYYENFKPNTITKTHKDTYFLYIFTPNFLKTLKIELDKTTQISHIKLSKKQAKKLPRVTSFSKIVD